MAMESMGDDYLADIPSELVVRSQQNMEFALRLLDQERRQQAIDEAKLSLTDEQLTKLHAALDSIASMSFQEALQALKDVGVTRMM
jgi:hypothetical protein